MNPSIKLVLYVVLLGVMAWLGFQLRATLNAPLVAPPPALVSTNGVAATNASAATEATNATSATDATNATNATNAANTTNAVSVTNATPSTNPVAIAVSTPDEPAARKSSKGMGRVMGYLVAMLFTLVGLALLVAQDVSRFFANRLDDFIFNDNLEGVKDPEYEEAEKVWEAGRHLEAIQLMRNYLKRHPREQYVALRIAEIYESNLGNYLAAALEYEEILKKKLPAERLGWAAVHLANLYSGKLNKSPEATRLLRRIVEEYGHTVAAKKARERLGIPEPVEAPTPAPVLEPEPEPEAKSPPPPPSNLPPGFRPK